MIMEGPILVQKITVRRRDSERNNIQRNQVSTTCDACDFRKNKQNDVIDSSID